MNTDKQRPGKGEEGNVDKDTQNVCELCDRIGFALEHFDAFAHRKRCGLVIFELPARQRFSIETPIKHGVM
jgi:hypothetical protein